MKKLLSILIIMVLMISLAPMAFAADYVLVKIVSNPTAGGVVTIAGTSETTILNSGSADPVTITEKPNTGYQFDGWSISPTGTGTEVGSIASTTTVGTYTFQKGTDANPVTITANFSAIPVSDVALDAPSKNVAAGTSFTLTATVSPNDAFNKNVTWSSNRSDVTVTTGPSTTTTVTVDTNVSSGTTAIITATAADGSGKSATCTVTVMDSSKIVTVPTAQNFTYDETTHQGIPANSGYDLGGTYTASYAGTYTATATLKENYVWSDGSTETPRSFAWTISPKLVDVPTAVTGLIYDGTEKTGVVLPTDAKYTLSGNTSTTAGEHTATATLSDKKNYAWNVTTPTTDDQSITWSISKKTITPPTAPSGDFQYTGNSITPFADTTDYTVTNPSFADAGRHTSTLVLRDKTNTMWSTTQASEDMPYTWGIGYGITFDGNGGTASQSLVIADSATSKIATLPTATKAGYTLAGWYTATTGGTKITTDTAFTANTTVYAQWTASTTTYTVTMGKYTGASYGKAEVSYDGGYTWSEISSAVSYTFATGTRLVFRMTPYYSTYYSHPYVQRSNGSYYAPTMWEKMFEVYVTDNLVIRLNFTTSPPTGDTSVWQYVVAALASTGVGTGAVIKLKKNKRK